MKAQRLSGPSAGVRKYDVLTCMAMAGLAGGPGLQTTMTRLIALVTARYNWREDALTVGQRDIAVMWAVTERTVKREVKRLQDLGVLRCLRPGVKGRVAAYRLNQRRIAELAEPAWARIGPDFEARMRERFAESDEKVVPLRPGRTDAARPAAPEAVLRQGQGLCARAFARIADRAPDTHDAWFSRLEVLGFDSGVLRVRAPSPFVARYIETHLLAVLAEAVEAEEGPLDRVEFIA